MKSLTLGLSSLSQKPAMPLLPLQHFSFYNLDNYQFQLLVINTENHLPTNNQFYLLFSLTKHSKTRPIITLINFFQ